MNVVFDGNYLFHKTLSVFRSYDKDKTIEELFSTKENRQMFIRKVATEFCFALKRFPIVSTVTFVFDKTSWRKKFYKAYKNAPTDKPKEDRTLFIQELFKFAERLKARGFSVIHSEGLEGDDVLFLVRNYFNTLQLPCTIISGDRDISQLVDDQVTLFCNNSKDLRLFVRALEENQTMCEDALIDSLSEGMDLKDLKIMHTWPKQIVLQKTILGDSGDNVPNLVKGFGEKTLEKYMDTLMEAWVDNDISNQDLSEIIWNVLKEDKKFSVLENPIESIKTNMTLVRLHSDSFVEAYQSGALSEEETDALLSLIESGVANIISGYSYSEAFDMQTVLNLPFKK